MQLPLAIKVFSLTSTTAVADGDFSVTSIGIIYACIQFIWICDYCFVEVTTINYV